jgi:hypothetical protein
MYAVAGARYAAKTLGTAPWKLNEPIRTVGSKLCSRRKCGQCPVEDERVLQLCH